MPFLGSINAFSDGLSSLLISTDQERIKVEGDIIYTISSFNPSCYNFWLSSKESACNAGDSGSIPGSGRSPGGGHGNSLHYSCWENPMDRGAGWLVYVVAKSQTHLSNQVHNTCYNFYMSVWGMEGGVKKMVSKNENKPQTEKGNWKAPFSCSVALPEPWIHMFRIFF